ncbi:MAG TPA: hypothetical protein VFI28_00270 [Candidatus Limnocylindrales bacterium]|nr:hypothetical protein [Candidatus Limnocylindrales bacterium]
MAVKVVIAARALADLTDLIESRDLPADTGRRVRTSLEQLETFPLLGKRLTGRWRPFRMLLGTWPWMLLIYLYAEETGTVTVVAIHDARSVSSATSEG